MVDALSQPNETEPAPSATELVIGLVGALGTDLKRVASTIESRLHSVFSYDTESVSISGLMSDLDWPRNLTPSHEDARIKVNMDAGRDLNDLWKSDFGGRHDALARLAVLKIDAIRRYRNEELGRDPDATLDRFAYVLRSFKRPDEIALLRAIYGDRFVLFGAFAPRARREKQLYDLVWQKYGDEDQSAWHSDPDLRLDHLIQRDEREQGEGGQNVRDTFHLADFFVHDHPDRVGAEVERSLRLLFGDPFITPTKDEVGVAHATTAALRSAEPGRQVGAAVANARGDVLATGCNEVPRAFGGQYWADDDDVVADGANDGREFRRADGRDTNNVQQTAIADEVLAALRDIVPEMSTVPEDITRKAVLNTRLGAITEFGRAIHAEMAAVTTASRLNGSLQDATIYCTTFPCHNCARHIIGTGIRRLVYIAPYAKSQAFRLHSDALEVAPDVEPPDNKVIFEPFFGVAPRRYSYLFDAPQRKDDEGAFLHPDPRQAIPRLRDVEAQELGLDELGYHVRETTVVFRTRQVLKIGQPGIKKEEA